MCRGAIDGVFEPDEPHLQILLSQIEGLSRLVEDLRTLSLAESGKLSLDLQKVDLAEEARAAVDALRLRLDEADMRVDLELERAHVQGDRVRIRQAIVALVENARRHAKGGGRVRVETAIANDCAILRVLDDGAGMREEDLALGFESFWRGDASRARESGGSGLGLSVVAAIVKAHGGEAALSNRPEGGLCAQLTFPTAA
jgi:two-component system, OmpR family, sensor histidine kinase AdeS